MPVSEKTKLPASKMKKLFAMIEDLNAAQSPQVGAVFTLIEGAAGKGLEVALTAKAKRISRKAKPVDDLDDEIEDEEELDDDLEDEDEDELEDDLDDDLDDDLEDEDEDELGEEAPKKRTRRTRSTRSAKTAEKPTRRSRRKPAAEVEDEDEDEVALPPIKRLTEKSIAAYLENTAPEAGISDTYAKTGIRELNGLINGLGFDAAEISGEGTRAEKLEMLRGFMSSIEVTINAVAEHGVESVSEAYEELTDEELSVRGTAKTKPVKAATALVHAVIESMFGDDDE